MIPRSFTAALVLASTVAQVQSQSKLVIQQSYTDQGGESATFLGCYSDSSSSRSLPFIPTSSQINYNTLTPASCSYACAVLGQPISGTEFGAECYCGPTISQSLYLGADTTVGCNMACVGNSSKSCGAGNNLLVYNTTLLPTVAPSVQGNYTDSNQQSVSLLGCFLDSSTSRTLPYQISGDQTMTPQICSVKCSAIGYAYSGVEYGSQCFCGTAAPSQSLLITDGSCNTPCSGNSLRYCGGGNRIHVYLTSFQAVSLQQGYQGCFVNTPSNMALAALRIPGYVTTLGGRNMTIDSCISQCSAWQFVYAGLTAGNQCSCGAVMRYSTATTGCTTPCAGNQLQQCGGTGVMSLYTTGLSNNLGGSDYLVSYGWSTAVGFATFSGCFLDTNGIQNPVLPTPMIMTPNTNTPAACLQACATRGFSVAGVEYGSECYCGNALPPVQYPTLGNCYMACSGNSSLVCGGPNALTVYTNSNVSGTVAQLGALTSVGVYTSVGCFADLASNRSLPFTAPISGSLTPALCMTACQAAGYSYAGLEYARECYCGIAIGGTAALVGSSTACTMPCQGQPTVSCGGGNAMQIYYAPTLVRSTLMQYISGGVTWNYQSCWGEPAGARAFPNRLPNPSGTIQGCLDAGNAAGFGACGLEYGGECWCGTNSPGGGLVYDNATYCGMPCSGDPLHFCGGGFTLTRYSTQITLVDMGCWIDGSTKINGGNRVLSIPSSSPYNTSLTTPRLCATHCASRGYQYSGTEYYGECYCSSFLPYLLTQIANTTGNFTAASAAGCNLPCKGDASQTCGGSNRLSVLSAPSVAKAGVSVINTTASDTSLVTWNLRGCLRDPITPRVFATRLAITTYNLPSCLQAASQAGFAFAGMEYTQECYGSNTPPAVGLYDAAVCSNLCPDANSTFCGGGGGAMTYYSTDTPKYLGCYSDSNANKTLTYFGTSTNVTTQSCAASCVAAGYIYAGTEFGGQCFCDNVIGGNSGGTPLNATAAANSCNMACTANPSQACGGSGFLSLYSVFAAMPTSPAGLTTPIGNKWTNMGCIPEVTNGRALPTFLITSNATVESCLYTGQDRGFSYCGLEYYGQCFCSTTAPTNTTNISGCNLPCTGNPRQLCGGSNALQYYVLS